MRRTSLLPLLALSPCFCLAGGPPFVTDDPQPVDFRHWEVYIASQNFHQFNLWTGTLPHVEVNYGAVPNLQLHVIAPMAYASGPGQPFIEGYGDTELGFKYRFMQETSKQPMVGIFPLVEVPTGSVSRGLGSGKTSFFLPVWLQKTAGSWTVYGGGGYWHVPAEGSRDFWFGGVTVNYQAKKNLLVGCELYHTTPQFDATSDVTGFNVGGVYDFDEGHHLMASIGSGIQGVNHGTAYVAFQWTFGSKEKAQ
ncbi:MAG TPA: hypothetical protein VG944_18105 [Fimbriimonas sp.]|nr:hypothetical protein [Fimbriimonas sp.]